MAVSTHHTIAEYVASFTPEIRNMLDEITEVIMQVAPDAQPTIKYGMPTFMLNGSSIAYFAVFKKHIGFYPVPTGVKEFEADMAANKTGKGSIQFPLDKPLPLDLIVRMVQYNAAKNAAKKAGSN